MTTYERAVSITLASEGVFSDHAWDPGGATLFGIAKERHPAWYERVSREPTRAEQVAAAKEFYRVMFWVPLRCDEIASSYIAMELFDTAVNIGPGTAVSLLQVAVNIIAAQEGGGNVTMDGRIGRNTIEAVNRLTRRYELNLAVAQNLVQGQRYLKLYERNPGRWHNAIAGWMRRCVVHPALVLKYMPELGAA